MNGFEFMVAHPWLTAILAFAISETVICVTKIIAIAFIQRRR